MSEDFYEPNPTLPEMTAEHMLGVLNDQGGDAGADFNDGDDATGWFGWEVTGTANGGSGGTASLTVWHRAIDGDGVAMPEQTVARFRLVLEQHGVVPDVESEPDGPRMTHGGQWPRDEEDR